jgi:DNA-binding Xre family transcriptional regulator
MMLDGNHPRRGVMGKKRPAQDGPQPERPGLVDQIREALRNSGQSLGELEQATGVDRGSLSRFLRGKRDLRGSVLDRLCRALNLRLTGGEGSKKPKK